MDSCEEGTPSGSNMRVMTRKFLFDTMQKQNLTNFDEKLNYLENYLLTYESYSDEFIKDIKHKFSHIKFQFKQRWTKAHKKDDIFLKNNEEWLNGTFELPKCSQARGRPHKPFQELSERSKRRRTEEIRKVLEDDVLIHATQTALQTSGKRDASKLLKEITTTTPRRATKYRHVVMKSKKDIKTQMSPLSALSMFVEADLSRRQYEIIRNTNKNFYPSYKVLLQEKKDCYPNKDSYRVTETCAEIKLQDLLNHTITRLSKYLEEILLGLNEEEGQTIEMIYKWGCDGSQQSQYKQKMVSDATDANIFQSCLVPLQLRCGANKNKILWQNPTPSSPRFCRPIRMRYLKESVDITNSEIQYIEKTITSLVDTDIVIGEKSYSVKHIMTLTMVDAKVCNAATQTSSTMKCYICGATSKQFNNLSIQLDVDVDALTFGLSVLHARIRFFESILHLSYKLPVKKWHVRSDSDKVLVNQRKKEIQKDFREKLGLIVDTPKAGFGNTNDGNTSRRFFANPEVAAEITGIDFNLIYRLKVILEVISCGHKIDLKKFADYTYETAQVYIQLYSWHPMTPTMHKLLIHGATVIDKALLPIGLLSEEAAEARNKHYRQYRLNYARKFSRELCNLDVLNRLLLSSDPLVSSMRPKSTKKSLPFTKEAIEMLVSAEPYQTESDSEESVNESDTSDEDPWHSSSS